MPGVQRGLERLQKIERAQAVVVQGDAVDLEMGIAELAFRAFKTRHIRPVLGGIKIQRFGWQGINAEAGKNVSEKALVRHIPDGGVDLDDAVEQIVVIGGKAGQQVEAGQVDLGQVLAGAKLCGQDLVDAADEFVAHSPAEPLVDGAEPLELDADKRIMRPLGGGEGFVALFEPGFVFHLRTLHRRTPLSFPVQYIGNKRQKQAGTAVWVKKSELFGA